MVGARLTTAAGGVVWRPREGGRPGAIEVLLVHRPGYDDWTFPKGKPDPREDLTTTAVREIAEETGVTVRLGHPLPDTQYRIAAGPKRVCYWIARPIGGDHATFRPNREIDDLRWVRPAKARSLLTYAHDKAMFADFSAVRDLGGHEAKTLIVVRHSEARPRSEWSKSDDKRPLTDRGRRRARALIPLLAAYGVRRIVSSPSVRCVKTIEPFALATNTAVDLQEALSEQGKPDDVQELVEKLLRRKRPTALSTHRPMLPTVFEALGLDPIALEPGAGVVLHHRDGTVLAIEPLGHPRPRR